MVEGQKWIEKLRNDRLPPLDVMREMLRSQEDICKERQRLHTIGTVDWEVIYALDYQADFQAMTAWFDKLLTDTPPPPDINGLYFCLLPNPLPSPFSNVAQFVTGSRNQEQGREWGRDFHWQPEDSVYNSPLLTSLYAQFVPLNHAGAIEEREMALFICWQWTGLVVAEWMGGPLRAKMRGEALRRQIAVGLDFFVHFNLGDLTPENLPT